MAVMHTMLSRLPQTGEQIDLYVNIIRPLGQLNLVPALSRSPSPSLTMLEDLLVDVEYLQVGRDPFDSIGLIDLRVNTLQSREERL